jgi:hypothetical protein
VKQSSESLRTTILVKLPKHIITPLPQQAKAQEEQQKKNGAP